MHNAPLSERILDLGNLNKSLFTDPFNININVHPTPWYRDYTTRLWIAGITCTVGLAFLGYKMIMDPTILQGLTGGPANYFIFSQLDKLLVFIRYLN